MNATISVLCFNNVNSTRKFLQMLKTTLPKEGVEVILVNNGSSDATEEIIFKSDLPNKIYMPFGVNLGFPKGHNEALKIAKGKYFICLNNDLIFNDSGWLNILLEPLKDSRIALVGLSGEYCTLRQDGMATKGEVLDYIDGACIAGRTELFKKHGLFSSSLKMFFFEDSDISLRYRQMGYRIATVDLRTEHLRSSTLKTIEPEYRNKIIKENQEIFKKRWGGYIKNRMFVNNILVRMFSHGGGDIICMTPILESLRKDHPTAIIELETSWPDVFNNNPYITKVYGVRHGYQVGYDRLIELNINYASYRLIVEEAEKISATKTISKVPQLFLTSMELKEGEKIVNSLREKEEDVIAVVNLQMTRSNWKGRCWNLDESKKLVKMMTDVGLKVIEIGKDIPSIEYANLNLINKTTLRQLFSVIANCDFFVGIDSMCLHVAQAFKKPSYVIFGATEPISRIVDFSCTFPIRLDDLPCIGCYQKKKKSTYNHCNLSTEDCMQKLTAEEVFMYIIGDINPHESNNVYLQNYIRGRYEDQ